jgi:hypothetical protein
MFHDLHKETTALEDDQKKDPKICASLSPFTLYIKNMT